MIGHTLSGIRIWGTWEMPQELTSDQHKGEIRIFSTHTTKENLTRCHRGRNYHHHLKIGKKGHSSAGQEKVYSTQYPLLKIYNEIKNLGCFHDCVQLDQVQEVTPGIKFVL